MRPCLVRSLILVAITIALLPPVSTAYAIPMVFGTTLSGGNEVPPNASPGAGTAVVVLDPMAQTLQLVASFFGLTTPDTMAHIHCCAPFGTNAGVATTLPAFPGFPLGVTQGTYLSPVFDLTQLSIYNPAFVTMQGGLNQAEAAFISGIENDQTYFNIHTTMFPGGEIRGQLNPLNPVPEPTTLMLLGTTMTGLGLIRRRRQRQNYAKRPLPFERRPGCRQAPHPDFSIPSGEDNYAHGRAQGAVGRAHFPE